MKEKEKTRNTLNDKCGDFSESLVNKRLDLSSVQRISEGLAKAESGMRIVLLALSDPDLRETHLYKKFCLDLEEIIHLRETLKPSVFL